MLQVVQRGCLGSPRGRINNAVGTEWYVCDPLRVLTPCVPEDGRIIFLIGIPQDAPRTTEANRTSFESSGYSL